MQRIFATTLAVALASAALSRAGAQPVYDVVIRGGTIVNGSGGIPFAADLAVKGHRIAAIAPHLQSHGKVEIDARGKAVSPGFINMLAHPEESLIADGRGLSDLAQGVTLEVMSENNLRREVALPWMSFDSDAAAPAPEGVFLLSAPHPRAYGNFARLLGHYVRENHDLTLQEPFES